MNQPSPSLWSENWLQSLKWKEGNRYSQGSARSSKRSFTGQILNSQESLSNCPWKPSFHILPPTLNSTQQVSVEWFSMYGTWTRLRVNIRERDRPAALYTHSFNLVQGLANWHFCGLHPIKRGWFFSNLKISYKHHNFQLLLYNWKLYSLQPHTLTWQQVSGAEWYCQRLAQALWPQSLYLSFFACFSHLSSPQGHVSLQALL